MAGGESNNKNHAHIGRCVNAAPAGPGGWRVPPPCARRVRSDDGADRCPRVAARLHWPWGEGCRPSGRRLSSRLSGLISSRRSNNLDLPLERGCSGEGSRSPASKCVWNSSEREGNPRRNGWVSGAGDQCGGTPVDNSIPVHDVETPLRVQVLPSRALGSHRRLLGSRLWVERDASLRGE